MENFPDNMDVIENPDLDDIIEVLQSNEPNLDDLILSPPMQPHSQIQIQPQQQVQMQPQQQLKMQSQQQLQMQSQQQMNSHSQILQPEYLSCPALDTSFQKHANNPWVEIIEQPASKALRFRYECEGRLAGSIPGVNSTQENKTYPTIKIHNFDGPAQVVVSCVTKDKPYLTHPHNLVGKEICFQGVCKVDVHKDNMTVSFTNLGIQCVKKKEIRSALEIREGMRIDPFNHGYDHKNKPTSIDLNSVRLCFEVYLKNWNGKRNIRLTPKVSEPIFDKKAMSELIICKLSHCSATVEGTQEMILLCEKISKEDTRVKFFETNKNTGETIWEAHADFQPANVHKQVAISFRTPKYHTQDITSPVEAFIQLEKVTDGNVSEPLPFLFLPPGLDNPDTLRRKRKKLSNGPARLISNFQCDMSNHDMFYNPVPSFNYNYNVKSEPEDKYGAASPLFTMGNQGMPNTSGYNLQPSPNAVTTTSPLDYQYNLPLSSPNPDFTTFNQYEPQPPPSNQFPPQPSTSSVTQYEQLSTTSSGIKSNQTQMELNRITNDLELESHLVNHQLHGMHLNQPHQLDAQELIDQLDFDQSQQQNYLNNTGNF